MRAIIAGSAAGIAGAIVWGLIAYYANFEIGWLAWGIGAIVGIAVAWGSEGGPAWGGIAVVIAVLSIVIGKAVAIEIAISDARQEAIQHHRESFDNDEYIVSWLADDLVRKEYEAGREINWPTEQGENSPESKKDYPPQIWSQAQNQWDAMTSEEKEQCRTSVQEQFDSNIGNFASIVRSAGLKSSFGIMDVVFFLLAIVTAYKIGSKTDKA